MSVSVEAPYEALLAMLPTEEQLNVDETGHKDVAVYRWPGGFPPDGEFLELPVLAVAAR